MKAQGAELVDVALPDLEPVLKVSSVIAHEFRFDFADYLAKHPGAPISSIADMAGKGLTHEAIDARLKIRATTDKRDEKAYAEALAKRDVARKMILDAMEKAKVDVLVYPSAMQPPLFWGAEAFGIGTCAMSSQTGLPAMSIPLGLSANALPVGLDLLGRPFDEQRLLNLAYGWEQAAHPRTAPFSTPALVNGKAPAPSRFTVKVADTAARTPTANIAFTYDPLTADLRFDARIAGLGRDEPVALTLQRSDEGKPGAVIALLLRAGQSAGTSSLRLDTRARADLAAGRLFVHLYTRDHPLGAGRVALPAQ
jgi:amidase